jgi:PAS domain S-box-containing protein
MTRKNAYSKPRIYRHDAETEHPSWIRDAVNSIRKEFDLPLSQESKKATNFVTLVDTDRRYVEVSDSFCKLLGYRREELIGKQYDELTAPDTSDIDSVFTLFSRLGYMEGLWMLVTRQGTSVLVRYESWIRPDSYIEGHMELVGAGY